MIMSTTTMGFSARMHGAAEAVLESTKGIFGRMMDQAIAARQAEARRRAAVYMHYLSDQRLVEMGMSAQDIQLMRDSGRVPPTFWS
jgi:hypothetical protein